MVSCSSCLISILVRVGGNVFPSYMFGGNVFPSYMFGGNVFPPRSGGAGSRRPPVDPILTVDGIVEIS